MGDDLRLEEEAQARRALLHMLEDLEREREALLRAHRQWLETVDAVREPLMVHDEQFRVVRANRAYAERSGMAFAELLGRPYWECFPKRSGPLPGCGTTIGRTATRAQTDEEFTLESGEIFVSRVFRLRDPESGKLHSLHFFEDVTASRRAREERLSAASKLRHALEGTIETIAATIEMRDPYTAGHQRRVAELARAIALEMGMGDAAQGIHLGALIHDLGKIQVPAEILAKPSRLTAIEFELIKTHAQAGYEIIKGIEFPWPVATMVHQHHERLDGSGYPQRLKGDAIALEARVLAVADVVEAMSSHRPYRPGLGMDAALREIADKRESWFDPQAVDACLRLFREKGFRFT